MRKIHGISALALALSLSIVPAAARQLSVEEAIAAAMGDMPSRIKGSASLSLKYTATARGLNTLYVVSAGTGYMVLAADDAATPLLGYSDSGHFDAAAMPPAMKEWLDDYSAQIAAAAASGGRVTAAAPREGYSSILPIVRTKWNQDAPYNDLCPKIDGRSTYTGCVATAVAQIMNVHRWPAQGRGSNSYVWEYYDTSNNRKSRTLTCDFSQFTFDWDNMADTYTGESTAAQNSAVASLMVAAGYASNMRYGLGESGASTGTAAKGLIDYFDYDKGLLQYPRNIFPLEQWADMLCAELSAGRPVLYSAQNVSNTGGHAFVIDGYSAADGLFHVNWGWGGMSDGYFVISTLDPGQQGIGGSSSGYSNAQEAVMGIRPAQPGSEYGRLFAVTGTFGTEQSSYPRSSGQLVTVTERFQNLSIEELDVRIGLKLVNDESGEATNVWWIYSPSPMTPGSFFEMATFRATAFPASGTYTATPIAEAGGAVYDMPVSISSPQALKVECTASTVTFTPIQEEAALTATAPVSAGSLYEARAARFTTTVSNAGSEYYAPVELRFMQGATQVASIASGPVDLTEGAETEVVYSATLPAALKAGTYTAGIYDNRGKLISPTTEIVVNAVPAGSTSITLGDYTFPSARQGDGTYANPARVNARRFKFSARVGCTAGLFAGNVDAFVFHTGGGTSLTALTQTALPIGAGESTTLVFSGDISDAVDDGGTYMVLLRAGGTLVENVRAYFTVDNSLTGISDVVADAPQLLSPNPADDVVTVSAPAAVRAVNVYTMDGAAVVRTVFDGASQSVNVDVSALAPGVYIVEAITDGGRLAGRLVKR